jgi:hypothetical protein
MKKKLMEALKTKFNGVDDAILDRIATKRGDSLTDENEIPAIVEGLSFQDVLTSYGDFRAGDASVKAVANYEKKHNIKDGKTIQQKPADPPEDDPEGKEGDDGKAVPSWAKAILESNKKLTEDIATMKGEKVVSERRQKLDVILEKLPEHQRKGYARMDVKSMSDEAFAELLTEVSTEVDSAVAENEKQGLSFTPPAGAKGGSGGTGGGKDDIDSLVTSIEKGTKEKVETLKKSE